MAVTQVEVDAQVEAAVAAIDADDYAAARKALVKMGVLLAGIPDNAAMGIDIRYYRQQQAALLEQIDQLEKLHGSTRVSHTYADFRGLRD